MHVISEPKDRLIVALDVNDPGKALALADELAGSVGALKVGFELFTTAGPGLVEQLVDLGHRVFLDLKLHDIPNTVARTASVLGKLGVFMFNVHACGGMKMMQAAALAVKKSGDRRPLLIGVTVLTSMGPEDLQELGIGSTPLETAALYARLAQKAGLDGVVASAREAGKIKELCGPDFLVVSPGIRPADADAQDQKRIMTPAKAIAAGCDFIVVGRPIYQADSPKQAALDIIEEIRSA